MDIKNKLRIRTMFGKFFFSYMLISIILVLLISSLLFRRFSEDSIKQINNILDKTLMQSQNSVEYIMDQAMRTCFQLVSNNDVIQQMNLDERDTLLESKLIRDLNYLINLNESLYSICIYNKKTNSFLSTESEYEEDDTVKWLEKSNVKICSQIVPRKVDMIYESGKKKNIYSVFYFDRSVVTGGLLDAIIVNLKEEAVRKAISNLNTEKNTRALIIDSKGFVVSGRDHNEYMKDFSGMHFVGEIIKEASAESGNLIDTVNGEKVLITYSYSHKLDWYFIYMIPYKQAIGSVNSLRNAVIAVSLVILIISLIISAFISGKISSPFRKIANNILRTEDTSDYRSGKIDETEIISRFYLDITNKIEKLENYRQYSQDRIKADFLRDVLSGLKNPGSNDLSDIKLELDLSRESAFVVAVLRIDKLVDLRNVETSETDIELMKKIRITICSIAEDTFKGQFCCEAVEVSDDVVLLVNITAEKDTGSFVTRLKEFQDRIRSYMDASITAGVGMQVDDFSMVGDSYRSALMAAGYRIVNGEGAILVYEEVFKNLRNEFDYPYNKEKVLLDSIRLGRVDQVEPALNDIFRYLKECHYEFIVLSINHLLFSVYLTTEISLNTYNSDSLDLFDRMVSKVRQLETLDQIKIWFLNYINFKLQKNNERKNSNTELILQIENIIAENISNSGLSVEMVASKFNYNATYFGKLFRELFNKSFLEYVSELKIKKANEYMKNNKLTIKEISIRAGFNNPTYFVTWYKKNTGLSPSEYRQKIIIDNGFVKKDGV